MYNTLLRGLTTHPPKPHRFVTSGLESNINPFFKVKHTPLKPITISNYKITRVRLPTHAEIAKQNLPDIIKTRSYPWKGTCPRDNWIDFDNRYSEFIKTRLKILKYYAPNVIGCKDISYPAIRELFSYVIRYIANKYPGVISLRVTKGIYRINNRHLGKIYFVNVAQENGFKLLTILSECVPIDFTILHRVDGVYYVIASNSLFSINWQVSDRLGFDIIKLHGTSPGWQPGELMYNKYVWFFDNYVSSGKITRRVNIFVVNTPDLFLPVHKPRVPLDSEIGNTEGYRLQDLFLRRELQTFHLLPISGLIVFGVQTFTQRLDTLSYSELLEVRNYVSKWDDYTANYHDRDTWLPVIDKYLKDNKP